MTNTNQFYKIAFLLITFICISASIFFGVSPKIIFSVITFIIYIYLVGSYNTSVVAFICMPLSIFFATAPTVTFSGLGLMSLIYLLRSHNMTAMVPPIKSLALYGAFAAWGLIACLWSPTPGKSLADAAKIILIPIGAIAFYAAHTESLNQSFMKWFKRGYILAIPLLILDQILDTRILRTLRGEQAIFPEYYHGITLLVFGIWPILNASKNQHITKRILLVAAAFVAVFCMSDHSAKLALLISFPVFFITYLAPKLSLRLAAIVSTVVILGFPFAIKNMDPIDVIEKTKSYLFKYSYHHRLFILKRTDNLIFESPWIGHGLNVFRSTIDPEKELILGQELMLQIQKGHDHPMDLQVIGQGNHPHNISMQVWYELGAIGALLFCLFISTSLWRLSNIHHRQKHMPIFMGLYSSIFVFTHTSFGAWEGWWLISGTTLLALTLWQTLKQDET